jgi:1,4-dihydroxy-2-naphthoate octaprenyltransferase
VILYFLGSCFLLGKILFRRAQALTALFIGLAAWLFAISIAVHFPISTRWTYLIAFAIPYVARAFRSHRRSQAGIFFLRLGFESRRDALALAAFLFVLLAHWLVALLPEVSADGLAMHLTIPMAVEHNRLWSFDFRQYAWALMPMGGDWAYTAVYLLMAKPRRDC